MVKSSLSAIPGCGSPQRLDAGDPRDGGKLSQPLGRDVAQPHAIERAVASGERAVLLYALRMEAVGHESEHHDDVARAARTLQRRIEPAARCHQAIELL